MENTTRSNPFLKLPLVGSILLSIIIIIIIIGASYILYQRTVVLLTNNLRDTITTISVTQASNINVNDLAQLHTKDDWQKPEWRQIVTQLHRAKYENKNIVFMYIFRKKASDPTQMEFVADADSINPFANDAIASSGVASILASKCLSCVDVNRDGLIEPEGPDKLQWPGQDYSEAVEIPETFEAYNYPLTSRELYTDAYGTVLTGYAPIRDEEGNTVAVLATDIKADNFLSITTQTLFPFLIFITFLTVSISILIVIILLNWRKYTKSIEYSNEKNLIINEKLKKLDASKDEFLSFATHQLRSPLTSIKWGLSAVMDEINDCPGDPNTSKTIERLIVTTNDLISTVNDLLDISKIEQGGLVLKMEKFDIYEMIIQLVEEFKVIATNKGLVLTLSGDYKTFLALGDRTKLRQVFVNIIDNAIKYTKSGIITVSFTVSSSNDAIISVTDTGPGMSPEECNQLFNKFIRGAAGKMSQSGSGLGLYLAKKIIEIHNGVISAESDGVGTGSTFTVKLPTHHE